MLMNHLFLLLSGPNWLVNKTMDCDIATGTGAYYSLPVCEGWEGLWEAWGRKTKAQVSAGVTGSLAEWGRKGKECQYAQRRSSQAISKNKVRLLGKGKGKLTRVNHNMTWRAEKVREEEENIADKKEQEVKRSSYLADTRYFHFPYH